MKLRDIVTFVFLAAGIVGVLGGIGAISRDIHLGWASVGVGLLLTLGSYRAMKRTVEAEIEEETEIDRRAGSTPTLSPYESTETSRDR